MANENSWNPIATAPKDGTEIEVQPDAGYDRAYFEDGLWIWYSSQDGFSAIGPEPKGWMPLQIMEQVQA